MEKIHVLIDPGFIRNYRNMEPVLGRAVKSEKNPLFRDDNSEAGKNVRYCSYPNVFRDPAAGLYRCYYTVLLETEERQDGRNGEGNQLITALAYAQSPDGLAWERPALGITGFRGSSNNNLLRLYAHGSSVIYDEREKDPGRRYKLLTRDDRQPQKLCAAFSGDGLHFGEYKSIGLGKEIVGDTHNFCFYDNRTGSYRLTTRAFSGNNRLVMSCTSSDFIHWSGTKQIFRGNYLEDQSYSMPVFFYAGLYFGLVSIYHSGNMDSLLYDKVECELVCSTDCESFSRITPHKAFIPLEKPDNDGCVYCSAPVEQEDEWWFYYTGANGLHSGFRNASLQLARLKKAFLAGMGVIKKDQPAQLQTIPLEAAGQELYLTLRTEKGGSAAARLLEADGVTPAEGYGYEDFDTIPISEGEWRLTWKGKPFPDSGGTCIVEFRADKAVLYQLREAGKL